MKRLLLRVAAIAAIGVSMAGCCVMPFGPGPHFGGQGGYGWHGGGPGGPGPGYGPQGR